MFSPKWLIFPLSLSVIFASGLSLSAVPSRSQDPSQENAPEQSANKNRQDKNDKKDKNADSAKKQARAATAAKLPAVIWRDPGDIASLDLVNGEGGADRAPRPDAKYTFVKEDLNGTSAKFYVKDGDGVEWLVKLGPEAKPETAATRFVWAMGYFTDEDYFLPAIHVSGISGLRRKSKDVSADGTAANVRLKREGSGAKKLVNWDWYDNPFVGQREFNGLRVMMAVINNWDLKAVNNKVYAADTERRYVASDLGASFGKTGAVSTRSKGVLGDYEESRLIKERKADTVSLEMRTRPLPVLAPFETKNFVRNSRMERIEEDIPIADAAWIGGQLTKLTPQQIADAFRTAGYSAEEVKGYTLAIQKRIAELHGLEGSTTAAVPVASSPIR